MKIANYTLNPDGTVPDYVLDGGYFPHARSGLAPQDWTLTGVCTDDAPVEAFADIGDLEGHLVSIGAESWTDPDGQSVDVSFVASYLWSKLSLS